MVLQINVSQQLKGPIGSTRDYQLSGTVDITGDGSTRLAQGEIRLTRTNHSILVKGRLLTEVELACSRCLSPFSSPLVLNIEEEYFPTADAVSGALLPPPDESGAFTIDEQHSLDLSEAVRQYALLAIPMKPLCQQDCAGLCPDCGHNLNQGDCHCRPEATDPRWAALGKLASTSQALTNDRKGTE